LSIVTIQVKPVIGVATFAELIEKAGSSNVLFVVLLFMLTSMLHETSLVLPKAEQAG